MDHASLAILATLFLGYALVSGRLEGTVITAPLVFAGFGLLAGSAGLGFADIDVDIDHDALHDIAELTLILVLFAEPRLPVHLVPRRGAAGAYGSHR